jgi:L-threonylcarbamoyladenylate synthase
LTKLWKVNAKLTLQDEQALSEAASYIQLGKTVAFPTETVYGLGAHALHDEAVQKIFIAKGRPTDNPLIAHIAHSAQLEGLVREIPKTYQMLMNTFWPGPLTLIFQAKESCFSKHVTAGLDTVGIRIPAHPVALHFLQLAGCPVAAPSANSSGKPSPTFAEHVIQDLDGKIDGIIDSGQANQGIESTVVQLQNRNIMILRPGAITKEQLQQVVDCDIQELSTDPTAISMIPSSPGMKYTHYAPKGQLTLIESHSKDRVSHYIATQLTLAKHKGQKTGVLLLELTDVQYDADLIIQLSEANDLYQIAQNLYHTLRKFDEAGIEIIIAQTCAESGLGVAIMDRLRKAAGNKIIYV